MQIASNFLNTTIHNFQPNIPKFLLILNLLILTILSQLIATSTSIHIVIVVVVLTIIAHEQIAVCFFIE